MNILETARSALWSLRSNKLRSLLSMLGIIIGVGAVVAVVSIGVGARQDVISRVSALGSNLIMISPTSSVARGGAVSVDASDIFTLDIANQLQQSAPAVKLVAPQIQGSGLVMFEGSNLRASYIGTSPEYKTVANYTVQTGRFIHELDVEHRTNVVVLGSTVATNLFGTANPVGQRMTLVLNNRRFNLEIVGVMESKGQVMMGNYDSQIYVPVTTALERYLRRTTISTLLAQANSSEQAKEAVIQAEFFLYSRLGTTEGFRVTSQDEMLDAMNQMAQTLQIMLGAIASISLIVGGIGVMNIMLVSVTERTQEIGTRKALGAKQRDLLLQFIMESLALSVVGGTIGLGLGALLTRLAGSVGNWSTTVDVTSLIVAFTFSAAIGLAAGVYPAMKAAKLDPVAALSYE